MSITTCPKGCTGIDPELAGLGLCSKCDGDIPSDINSASSDAASNVAAPDVVQDEIQEAIEASRQLDNKKKANNLVSSMIDISLYFKNISEISSLEDLKIYIGQWAYLFEKNIDVKKYPFLQASRIEDFFKTAFDIPKGIIEFGQRAMDLDWENTAEKKVFYNDLDRQNRHVLEVILSFWPYTEVPPPPPPRRRNRNRPQPLIPSVEGNKAPSVPERSLKPKLQYRLSKYSPPTSVQVEKQKQKQKQEHWTCDWRFTRRNGKKITDLAKNFGEQVSVEGKTK